MANLPNYFIRAPDLHHIGYLSNGAHFGWNNINTLAMLRPPKYKPNKCTHLYTYLACHVSVLQRESIQDIHNFGHVEFNHYLSNKGPFLQKIKIELDTILWSWRYETFEKDSVINLWRVRIWKRNDPFKWCEPFVCWCCCCFWFLYLASGFYNFFGLNVLMLSGKSSC